MEAKGYGWLVDTLLPALRALEDEASPSSRGAIARAYATLGDVFHVLFDAPVAGIRAYRTALRWDPRIPDVLKDMAYLQEATGMTGAARRSLLRARRAEPHDPAIDKALVALRVAPGRPMYRHGDVLWDCSELLARFLPRRALRISQKRSVACRQARMRALGALGEQEAVLKEWRDFARARGRMTLGWPDWFFLPDAVADQAPFWYQMAELGERVEPRVTPQVAGLADYVRRRLPPRARIERPYWDALVRYNIARFEPNLSLARRLSKDYPEWAEARKLVRSLTRLRSGRS